MKKALALAGLIGVAASLSAGSLSAAPKARKFAPHQEPRGIGNLVARGDRVTLVYDAGVKSATGFAYVRNDLRRRFVSLPLVAERGPASTYRARVPARLIRGHRLLYYAVLRDRYRKARVPGRGTSSAFVLTHARVVDLGTHRFGETRPPEQVVARARADQVGWQLPPPGQGPSFGPQSSRSDLTTRSGSTTASTTGCWSGTQAIRTRSRVPFRCPCAPLTTTSRSGPRARST